MNLKFQYGVEVPGGLWNNGVSVREVYLRPLCGEDEAFLLEAGESLSAPVRVTALLSRCILRVGAEENVTPEMVRALTVGDREALLLHLRRITYGERLPCLLNCTDSACGERMDLELKVSELLLEPYAASQEWNEVAVRTEKKMYRVRLRVPNGLDQEFVAERAWMNVTDAENLLLQRCVESVSAQSVSAEVSSPLTMAEWPAELADKIGRKFGEIDPQAEILLSLQCPACGQAFTGEFDAGAYLYHELRGHIPYLYREVHQMARSYHWSEAEILSMTPRKRSVYLNLLAGEEVFA
jgi:hypothetical protein